MGICMAILLHGKRGTHICIGNYRMNQPTQEQVNIFLDMLRESGVTNMFGASPYIREEFEVTRYDANRFLTKWMETFSERHPQ